MAAFTAADVKALREQLGTGMVDTKNALDEADGDIEKADRDPAPEGAKGNAKRADRSTSEGLVAADGRQRRRDPDRARLRDRLRREERAASSRSPTRCSTRSPPPAPTDVDAALAAAADGQTVAELIDDEAAHPRREGRAAPRRARVSGDNFAIYLHKTSKDLPPQVGVVARLRGRRRGDRSQHRAAHLVRQPDVPRPARTCRPTTVENERQIVDRDLPQRGQARGRAAEDRRGPRSTRFFKQVACSSRTTPATTSCPIGRSLKDAGLTRHRLRPLQGRRVSPR